VKDGITGTDVGEEGVTQTLACMSTFHQASNIHHIQKRWNLTGVKYKREIKIMSLTDD